MTEQSNGVSTVQTIVSLSETLVFLSFFVSLFLRAQPGKGAALWKARVRGGVLFGFFPPLLIILRAESAADLGGPLFLPLFAVLGAMLGFVLGTAYFFIFCRGK